MQDNANFELPAPKRMPWNKGNALPIGYILEKRAARRFKMRIRDSG